MSYLIPAAPAEHTELIKKSRFITLLAHTPGLAAARAFWQQAKDAHPDARHWCFAAVAGAPGDGQQFAMSDDGEPAGTAGKPMLAQLQGSGIGEISAVVVRYYGGIKLGTGGLVKAYGGGVGAALAALPSQVFVPQQLLELTLDYPQQPHLQRLLAEFQGQCLNSDFTATLRCTVSVPAVAASDFAARAALVGISVAT